MLEVQKFLETNTPDQLTVQLGINVKRHPQFPELYHLSYDQIESPKNNAIVHECRGLILNSEDNWSVVAYPFKRFANYGEEWGAPIDWTTARVQEKVDGSLIILWHYKGEWHCSTKGSPDAGGQVGDFGFTFSELFWKTMEEHFHLKNSNYEGEPLPKLMMLTFHPTYTYMIELTSMYNRVVCSYGEKTSLTLIGVRSLLGLEYPEQFVTYFDDKPFPVVKEYNLKSVSDIIAAAEALDPMKNEGFVVVDGNFNRCKIKSPSYVMIHHMKDGFGQRRMIRLIQLGETSEVLSYFPEYQTMFEDIKALIDAKIIEIEADWERLKHITDRKAFALEATKTKDSAVLFAMFLGRATDIREYILHSKKVIKKATDKAEAIEDFQFSEPKIEEMIGLKSKAYIPAGAE